MKKLYKISPYFKGCLGFLGAHFADKTLERYKVYENTISLFSVENGQKVLAFLHFCYENIPTSAISQFTLSIIVGGVLKKLIFKNDDIDIDSRTNYLIQPSRLSLPLGNWKQYGTSTPSPYKYMVTDDSIFIQLNIYTNKTNNYPIIQFSKEQACKYGIAV